MAFRGALTLFVVIGLATLTACGPGSHVDRPVRNAAVGVTPPVAVGQPAPPFQSPLTTGELHSLADELKQHKIVMLEFWATWCGPCAEEMPMLANLAREYADRGVGLLGVNQQEDAATVKGFLKQRKLNVRSVLDENGSIGERYGAEGIPMLVLVDSSATVRGVHLGYHPALENVLRDELEKLLSNSN